MFQKLLFFLSFLFLSLAGNAQINATIYGVVKDSAGVAVDDVIIGVVGKTYGTSSSEGGKYELKVSSGEAFQLAFALVGRTGLVLDIAPLKPGESKRLDVLIGSGSVKRVLKFQDSPDREKIGVITLDPRNLEPFPNITGNFETYLKTLPGVTSNNELSSQYNVRGGNYDENLIYVNDIEIYRPFLVRSGQQEGLSFINPNMVKNVKFSAGGFESRYGDKMSSVLDVKYKHPKKFASSSSLSLMGLNSMIEGTAKSSRFTYLLGVRYRANSYILNSLDVRGDYKPRFADIQSLISYDINEKLQLSLLSSYAENRYLMIPQNQETVFGTVTNALKLNIGFEGQELMRYQTMMSALTLSYQPTKFTVLKFIASGFNSIENEYYSVEGAYRLDQLENNLGSDDFAKSKYNRGAGYFVNNARNNLQATVINIAHRGYYSSKSNNLQWGLQYQHEMIDDKLHEWKYMDSADFSVPLLTNGNFELNQFYRGKANIESNRYTAYVQNSMVLHQPNNFTVNYGIRTNYWDLNRQNVISPRVQVSFEPNRAHNRKVRFGNLGDSLLKKDISIKAAFGYYYQPPFYRELRNQTGEVNINVKAQRAIHFVTGMDFLFNAWQRPFKFFAEAYYKKLDFLIPYEIDNVRIRYYATNNSKGYATGIDLRVNGEFIKGTESWASMSVMKVAENISNDSIVRSDGSVKYPGNIPRPTDQRVNFSVFFQDELRKNPKYKMHLMGVFGTGLPFGPPNKHIYNNRQRVPPYRRVDIGFSKMIIDEKMNETDRKGLSKLFHSAWISLEVFNLLQINNTISYLWIKDITNTYYAVPNYLTSRRLNVALMIKF
ncbi:MAG: TonB-dependent receptor plug domain-containing protein [Bacteroidia bacterium]|nr:TonB-dependent receptor plug domain-containing protein [Bacteroidia bacterium]